jgi:hypothetical protein
MNSLRHTTKLILATPPVLACGFLFKLFMTYRLMDRSDNSLYRRRGWYPMCSFQLTLGLVVSKIKLCFYLHQQPIFQASSTAQLRNVHYKRGTEHTLPHFSISYHIPRPMRPGFDKKLTILQAWQNLNHPSPGSS